MTRLEEVMQRIGSRPALIRAASVGDFFGENAPYRIEDGVAIIDIVGPLSNAKWSWGGTTYGEIQEQLKVAAVDPNVRGVLLNVNSPGGAMDNCFETAAMIADLKKPCYAVAATAAYSAAYLLASQADKIYCTQTSGGVGAIGVYCIHFDMSGMMQQMGVKPTIIRAGKGKAEDTPYEPLSDAARAEIQGEIDRLYGEFVAAVERGRGIAAAQIVKIGARCFEGANAAVTAGLADAPGDLSTAWVDMCSDIPRTSMSMGAKTSAATAAGKEPEMAEKQAAEDKVPTAAEIEAMVNGARVAGFDTAAEIVDTCAIAGEPGLAAGFITERKSVADVRTALLAKRVEKEKAGAKGKDLITGVTPGLDAEGSQGQEKASPWRKVLGGLGARLKEEVR